MEINVVEIYRHGRTGDVALMMYGPDPRFGYYIAAGPMARIPATEARSQLLPQLLNCFAAKLDDGAPREFAEMSKKAQRRFEAEHESVSARQDGTHLICSPMHRESGGRVGCRSEQVRIDVGMPPEQFWSAMLPLFDIASHQSKRRKSR
jgi:hypothetical protein